MSNLTSTSSTITNIGVAMFDVADQDAALAFYTGTLGFELRSDSAFGEDGQMRWIEVAPPGSTARLALNPPMGGSTPGGSSIGVESTDVAAERPAERDRRPRRRCRSHAGPGRPADVHAARPRWQPHRRGRGAARGVGPDGACGGYAASSPCHAA